MAMISFGALIIGGVLAAIVATVVIVIAINKNK